MMHGGTHDSKGFTLIELLVTLLIIAIISTISVGTLIDTGSDSPAKVRKKVADLFSLASDEAAITGKIKGIFYSKKSFHLREYVKKKAAKSKDGGSINSLLDSITELGGSSEEGAQDGGYTTLEDRGSFGEVETPSWSKEEIYTLQLPTEIVIQQSFSGGPAQTKNQASSQGEDDGEDEPMLWFFPDGHIYPEGSLTLSNNNEVAKITWKSNGKISE